MDSKCGCYGWSPRLAGDGGVVVAVQDTRDVVVGQHLHTTTTAASYFYYNIFIIRLNKNM